MKSTAKRGPTGSHHITTSKHIATSAHRDMEAASRHPQWHKHMVNHDRTIDRSTPTHLQGSPSTPRTSRATTRRARNKISMRFQYELQLLSLQLCSITMTRAPLQIQRAQCHRAQRATALLWKLSTNCSCALCNFADCICDGILHYAVPYDTNTPNPSMNPSTNVGMPVTASI